MAELLNYLYQQTNDWLVERNSQDFVNLVEQFLAELNQLQDLERQDLEHQDLERLPTVLLIEPDPVRFLAGFIAACTLDCAIFLGNPNWAKAEWEQALRVAQPDLIWGNAPHAISWPSQFDKDTSQSSTFISSQSSLRPRPNAGWIMIPTGGSSGKIQFAIHTWQTLMAAVQGFKQHFQISQVNSFCVLPLYHVSGLMQFLRSFTSGGKLVVLPFKTLEVGKLSPVDPSEFFLSLVPTQLQRLLQSGLEEWLSQFYTVLLGGAPTWPELLQTTRSHHIRLAPTYGMTETAAQIATLRPENFLNGSDSGGQVLPHAQVTICDSTNQMLAVNRMGTITIRASSLALGYYPEFFFGGTLRLDDLGFLDDQGRLHVVGRDSDKIITGGENVFPAEVEEAIRATNLVTDVCVVGVGDRHWGQVITAIYTAKAETSADILRAALKDKLSKFKQPKYWVPVQSLPRNDQGKVNRKQLQDIALTWLDTCLGYSLS